MADPTFTDDQTAFIITKVNDAVSGLKDKNTELIGKLKKATTQLNGFVDVDLKQLAKDSKTLKALQKKQDEAENNYKKLYGQQTDQHKTDTDKLTSERDTARKEVKTLKKTTKLQTALVEHHVDPVMMQAAEGMLLPEISLTDEGEAMVGDKKVTEFIKSWAETDVGKRFVTDGNSGGGAGGDGGRHPANEAKYFDKASKEYNLTKQAAINKTNPALYQKLAKAAKSQQK